MWQGEEEEEDDAMIPSGSGNQLSTETILVSVVVIGVVLALAWWGLDKYQKGKK